MGFDPRGRGRGKDFFIFLLLSEKRSWGSMSIVYCVVKCHVGCIAYLAIIDKQTLGKRGGVEKGGLEYHSVKHGVVPQRSPV